jgi:uncharacterized phiE125 gp8 family phage protein
VALITTTPSEIKRFTMSYNYTLKLYENSISSIISVYEVQKYLRLDDSDSEYNLLASFIKSASEAAEKQIGISIISKKWQFICNSINENELELLNGPINTIESVKVKDYNDVVTTYDSNSYFLKSDRKTICFKKIPSGKEIEIIYQAGISSSAENVPEIIKHALLSHIKAMYERKDNQAEMTPSVHNIYNFFKQIKI